MKQKRQLEPEQAAAAHAIDRHIAVTAGPGSGKTTVLVERYLYILLQRKLSIDQIVAITFTNRAANEMRERLREELDLLLQTASGDERQRLLSYKRTLDGAVITTIHGFCSRLLREFPVEAHIDPQFVLLDEHRTAMLLEAVVEEVLNEAISLGHEKISRLTLGVGRGSLATALADIYREVRGQGLALNELAVKTAATHASESDLTHARAELAQTMNEFLKLRRTTLAQRTNQSNVIAAWSQLQPQLHKIPKPDQLADYCRAVDEFRKVRPQARDDFKNSVIALDELIWKDNLAGRVPQMCLDHFARDYALELIHLLIRVDERLQEKKHTLSALDFADLELKALELLERPEVIARAAERYKFFLVDEFQDTNSLQRRLLEQLALQPGRRDQANLFIVGDRKQSIYGFRGADVDVFREMTGTLIAAGGTSQPLLLNFRSQPPLVNFFNYLFPRLFEPKEPVSERERSELGYVAHEPSVAKRELSNSGPLVELLVSTETVPSANASDDPRAEIGSREIDAEQLARRIRDLVSKDGVKYSDIALLFRAMTSVQVYESVFRRANIPYQTVLGRGFYEREEITDLIQLLRFLDNKTDELALAAVLRSPLVGISDNALLALRCAPWLKDVDSGDPLYHFSNTRRLFTALQRHREIAYIDDAEHELLDCAASFITELVNRRHHYGLEDLLRFAVERSEYQTVIAANFDGAQRLANVERLYTLAARFEQSGTYLIRDFVRYVEEFEAIGSRESEGQIDEAANAVRLMTIHQAKGLEFPLVIIPELQRYSRVPDRSFLLDRHRGLTLKVPDGRSNRVAGRTFTLFEQRNAWREEFESMRLLYVAATRAEDRLIFSGTNKDLESLNGKPETWLRWIWQSLELGARTQSGVVQLSEGVELLLSINPLTTSVSPAPDVVAEPPIAESVDSLTEAFPLLRPIAPAASGALQTVSVTQLINYQRCPRQYYFDRVVRAPTADELAVWNDAEAPEPPANLNATLKGAVIHRFCETYAAGDNAELQLRASFVEVISRRRAQLADRLVDIDEVEALKELWPLAQNYLASAVFERAESVRNMNQARGTEFPTIRPGLWSEQSFRLRRPWGILTGTIDKLLISPAPNGDGFAIEIIDFKTNRINRPSPARVKSETIKAVIDEQPEIVISAPRGRRARLHAEASADQFAFDFLEPETNSLLAKPIAEGNANDLNEQVRIAASDYLLQMQAYALAVHELLPDLLQAQNSLSTTLHFLHPNVEWNLPPEMLTPEACAAAIDEAMQKIIHSCGPEDFPVRPARHCGMCSFLRICYAGRQTMPHRLLRAREIGVAGAAFG